MFTTRAGPRHARMAAAAIALASTWALAQAPTQHKEISPPETAYQAGSSPLGQVETDSRGQVTWFGFDGLDRLTAQRADSSTGMLLNTWNYDEASATTKAYPYWHQAGFVERNPPPSTR